MICLMHEGNPYGTLRVSSKVILPKQLASMLGISLRQFDTYFKQLRDAGVCSVDDNNCIYSRRMMRDEEIRQSRANGGYKSENNPNVPRKKDTHKDTGKDTLSGSPLPPSSGVSPASASSSATSKTKESTKEKAALLSKNWTLPLEWRDWALNKFPEVSKRNIYAMADDFKDYWTSEDHKVKRKDWFLTWKNWVKRDNGYNPKKTGKFDAVAFVNRNNTEGSNDTTREIDVTSDSSVVSEQ